MKITWASVSTVLMAISAGMSVVPYGWAHITATATSIAALSLTGAYTVSYLKR